MTEINPPKHRRVKSIWCIVCQYRPASEVHHIILQASFRHKGIPVDNTEKNLADLCRVCHMLAPDVWEIDELDRWEKYKESGGYFATEFMIGARNQTMTMTPKEREQFYKQYVAFRRLRAMEDEETILPPTATEEQIVHKNCDLILV